jgi:periplasmic divalent cation tolerance protein
MIQQTFLLVLSTCPDRAKAEALARALVADTLAACVNIVPGLRSIYSWQGTVHEDDEVLLLVKTTADRFEALRERILELHPYETPEVVALELANGHDAYLRWIESVTRPGSTPPAEPA